MDPNVSTEIPADFTPVYLSKTTTLVVKFGIFGTFAIVVSSAIAFGVYLVFFKKKHQERKAARREEVARDMEKGILPKSRHYPIGKVPKIRSQTPYLHPQTSSAGAADLRSTNHDPSRSSTHSSKHSFFSSRTPRASCRVSRAPDPILDIPRLPKTMKSQKRSTTTAIA